MNYETLLPQRMRHLPRDSAGRPVPSFVEWVDGKPDFRLMNPAHMARCIRHHVCWVCDQPLGAYEVFTVGPMCVVNLVSSEPPSHLDCATYSAFSCPFLINPDKVRREANLPGATRPAVGVAILRNPGVTALVVTKWYATFRVDQPGVQRGLLFQMGNPLRVEWYANGSRATGAQVREAFDSGLPALLDAARLDGRKALNALDRSIVRAERWLP